MVAGNNQTQLWLRNHHRGVLAFSDCRFCSEMQRKSPEFTVQSEKTDHCFCVFCSKLSAAVKSILFPTITLRVLPWTETLLPPSDLHEQRRQTSPRHLRPPTYCSPPPRQLPSQMDDIQREHGTSTVYSILRMFCTKVNYKPTHYALTSHIVKSIYTTYSISEGICTGTVWTTTVDNKVFTNSSPCHVFKQRHTLYMAQIFIKYNVMDYDTVSFQLLAVLTL